MIYLDTSALATLYFPERMSAAVASAVRERQDLAINTLTAVEMASVAGLKIRTGDATPADARAALTRFLGHEEARRYRRLTIRASHYSFARDRIARFDAPLKTLDALHLATTALAGADLLTLDRALARAAEAAGVRVVVPQETGP